MNKLHIEPLEVEKTKVVISDLQEQEAENGILLAISGEIDMRDPSEFILPYLLRIHDEAIAQKVKILSVDFRELSYVNSSGIKTIISWLMKSKSLPSDQGYKVRIVQNSDIPWQESTFPVIQKLFPELITFSQD
ncbi:MAG TPA: hypothetical protein PLC82_00555 [Smithellaceae bacterium]|nr:hypothetical protein [Smithellaceae bacterium]